MNDNVKITDDIFYLGVNDRDTHLFENLWPLQRGVSYNSYLIKDNKSALIDTVKVTKMSLFLEKIRKLLNGKNLDFLIVNHMEPDHSGSILEIINEYPNIKIVGNSKTFGFLKGFYQIEKNLYEVKDGDEITLGKHNLKFHLTPMVHWPETMMTYEEKNKILFSGDAFGGFGTLDGGIFDDEVNIDFYENEIRRYYSNIVGKFSPMVQRALKKLDGLEIKTIAATHGPVWRSCPERIIEKYDKWSKYDTEKGVVIAYGTMYGNTEKMADYIARKLAEKGVKNVRLMNVSKVHQSYIINEFWKFKGLILGSCTYNTGLFPLMESLVQTISHLNAKNHILGVFGTMGWSGGGVSTIMKYSEKLKMPLVADPIESHLSPKEDDWSKLEHLAEKMAQELEK